MVLKNKAVQLWARRLHIYVSMALLLVVLFFAVTGITLNRPELFVKSQPDITSQTLSVPESIFASGNEAFVPDQAVLLAYLAKHADLSGTPSAMEVFKEVEDGELIEGEIAMDYKGPGFNATVFIDLPSRTAEIEASHYGVVAVLNDLHKGRNSGEVWKWFIDITAVLMVLFVMTGVCLLIPKKKTLHTSMKWMFAGSLVTLLVYFVAVP